jgi:serine protease DegQ
MNRLSLAIACGLLVTTAGSAGASIPVPVEHNIVQPTLAPLLRKLLPAVVTVSARVFEQRGAVVSEHSGSAVVFDGARGYLITNNHVIDHANTIAVVLADGRALPAKVVGSDPDTDVAVIKVAADRLIAIEVGDSDRLEIGDFVLAIGNPNNIGETVTSGIIGGLHRSNLGIEQYEDFIQTDAAIYPGNSGGALVNLKGELVGINTAFIGASNTNPEMGFAIPINMVRDVVNHIVEFGNAHRANVGMSYQDLNPTLLCERRLSSTVSGPIITKIDVGSAAERAGLRVGDVVIQLAGKPVSNAPELRKRLQLVWAGDATELTVSRNGTTMTVRLAVQANGRASRLK